MSEGSRRHSRPAAGRLSVGLCRDELLEALRESDPRRARSLIATALRQGLAPERLLLEAISPALESLGRGWEEHDVSLSQVYVAGRIAEEMTEVLLSRLPSARPTSATIVAGTVAGDHHGLGRRIVVAYLRSAGYRVVDLGLDVEPRIFVDAALTEGARIVAASALMSHTALRIRDLDQETRQRGVRHHFLLLVGGAPFRFNPRLALLVGADAYARHAYEAVGVVRRLLGEAGEPGEARVAR